MTTQADGYAEREAGLLMLADKQQGRSRRITVGADKAYDAKDFVTAARDLNVTPHVARTTTAAFEHGWQSDKAPCYCISLSCRWLVEKPFGWMKQTGPIRQVKVRGLHNVDWSSSSVVPSQPHPTAKTDRPAKVRNNSARGAPEKNTGGHFRASENISQKLCATENLSSNKSRQPNYQKHQQSSAGNEFFNKLLAQRSSRAVERSVFSSRYLTMIGV